MKILKTYEGFNLFKTISNKFYKESMSEEEIVNIIQDGKKIYVKYINGYPEHKKELSYDPVDIDGENISLNIDGKIFTTKLGWVQGIDENFGGFKEITFVLTDDGNKEVMFDILYDGTVTDIYCYNDGIPIYFNNNDNEGKLKTKPGRNSLFLHIKPTSKNIKKIIYDSNGYPIIESQKDWEMLFKMLEKYNIPSYIMNNWSIDEMDHYEVEPHMTEPLEDPRGTIDTLWKTDTEFVELLKDQGGIKGVIKKMKKKYNLNYSKCDTEEKLFQGLKKDGMI